MYVYVYICVVWVCVYIYICIYIYVCIYLYVCVRACICLLVHQSPSSSCKKIDLKLYEK